MLGRRVRRLARALRAKSGPGIRHRHIEHAIRLPEFHGNVSVVRCELVGVRQHIEQDLLQNLGIDEGRSDRLADVEFEFDTLIPVQRVERRDDLADLLLHLHLADVEFHAAILAFAEIEDLVDEVQQAPGVALDQLEVVELRAVGLLLFELFDRREQQRQRGSQLMRYVGEEVELGFVYGLFPHAGLTLQFDPMVQPETQIIHPSDEKQQPQEQQDISDFGTQRPPQGRTDRDIQRTSCNRGSRLRGGPDQQPIFARSQIVQRDRGDVVQRNPLTSTLSRQ